MVWSTDVYKRQMVGILLVFIGLFNTVINFLLAPRSKVPQAKTKTEESK